MGGVWTLTIITFFMEHLAVEAGWVFPGEEIFS
jgi:hypothetical protein